MEGKVLEAVLGAFGFFLIGCVTWFFSSRRRAFLRTFCPPGQVAIHARNTPRDDSYRQGMRCIAVMQMGLGLTIALIAVAWALAS